MNLKQHWTWAGLLALAALPLWLNAAERRPNVMFILTESPRLAFFC